LRNWHHEYCNVIILIMVSLNFADIIVAFLALPGRRRYC